MEKSNKNIEEIELYLDGRLVGEALDAFQLKLLNDKDFASRVNLMKGIENALVDDDAIAVQQTIENISKDFFKPKIEDKREIKINNKISYHKPILVAASLLFLVVCSFLFWWQGANSLSNQELYEAYYTPFQIDDLSRGTISDLNAFENAVLDYKGQEYKKASLSFLEILASNPDDVLLQFYLANSYLNQDPPGLDQAASIFKKIIENNKSVLKPKSKWYLAMIYLKQNKVKEARALVIDLKHSKDTGLANQAKKILDELN